MPETNGEVNGGHDYGDVATEKIIKATVQDGKGTPFDHSHILRTFRLLIADLCQQFGGGHPGGAIGMAAIGVALWKYVMRYAPNSPDFFNRDRFVLSNGHTCLFQYTFLHLTGYPGMSLDQLKTYHSKKYELVCPGHPEIEHEGIEVTTGPLGQGISNAVGMAAASKHLGAQFNKERYPLISNHIWCMVGDACLQEGVALEAISLAGHWCLNNLTVIYDNNQITCDGSVDMVNTEDINKKMAACGWEVVDVEDGNYDVAQLVEVLSASRSSKRPTFINVRTIIGLGSAVAGDAVAHGVALGADNVATMKKAYGFDPEQNFVLSEDVRDFFAGIPARGDKLVQEWQKLMDSYMAKYPEAGKTFKGRLAGEIAEDWQSLIPQGFPDKPIATRAASGLVFNPIAEQVPNFMVGTADLTPSVNMAWKTREAFQCPGKSPGSYNGRYVHYGIREHAMVAIANGMAAYQPNMIIPVTSSFFMFYIYAAAAVRMGALQRLQVIHVATHDSIGMGEDGPTHQPIELAALFRAMPNLLYIRPGDAEEVVGAWTVAIQSAHAPTIISTSRQGVPRLTPLTKRAQVSKGAYVLQEVQDADVTVLGVGAELNLAVSAARILTESSGLKVRVVSFPCLRLFEKQPPAYRRDVLKRSPGRPIVVVEPYSALGWERYANAAICMGTDRFGQSLPGAVNYEYFGFTAEAIAKKISNYVSKTQQNSETMLEFVEIVEAAGEITIKSY